MQTLKQHEMTKKKKNEKKKKKKKYTQKNLWFKHAPPPPFQNVIDLLSLVRRDTDTATAFPLEQMLFMGKKKQECDREKDTVILITLKLVWSVLRNIQ